MVPETRQTPRPTALAVFLIVAGVVGWVAAFALTLEKFAMLTDPTAALSCDISPLVQCGKNLSSAQGAVFGFPNPIIGLAAWIAPIVVGVAILSGARFSRWFWVLFNVGVLGAFVLVCWLISQSIFVLGTLCPWCMVTWAVTIPLFWALTLRNLATGALPVAQRARSVAAALAGWVPAITLACFVAVAVMAQLRLDVLATL